MSKKNSFVIYENWATLMANLPKDQAGDLIKSICSANLGLDYKSDDPTVLAMLSMILPKMEEDAAKYQEKCERLSENKKGETNQSRKKTNQSRKKTNQAEISGDTDTVTDTVIDTVNETDPENVYVNEAPEGEPEGAQARKHTHGQCGHVRLTDLEYARLVDQFGEDGAKDRIDALDLYIDSKGKQYKNHYSTILCWERRDQKEQAAREKTKGKSYQQAQSDAWLDQIAEWAQSGDGTAGGVNDG